jgi:microcystin-dependent protein
MSLEVATYINGLVAANPLGSDPLADADGHLRLLKSTIKATFPNITGPVTATQGTLNNPFPVGGIIMWSGASVPSGWFLCDGTNGTPNLRDRFIVGSGATYATGATGGASTVTLSAANLPAHSHSFSGTTGTMNSNWAHSHSVSDPGHSHSSLYRTSGGGADGGYADSWKGTTWTGTSASGTGIWINATDTNHTHNFSGTTSSYGSGTAFSNLPPYFALAFIMKGAY